MTASAAELVVNLPSECQPSLCLGRKYIPEILKRNRTKRHKVRAVGTSREKQKSYEFIVTDRLVPSGQQR